MVNKKGISPLIATVLLIGFTIVLAALVMRWGGTLFITTTQTTGCESQGRLQCTSTQFVFTAGTVTYTLDATTAPDTYSFVVNNEGTVEINKVIVQRQDSIGAKSSATKDYGAAPLAAGASDSISSPPFSTDLAVCADLKAMYATPVIKYQPSDGSAPCEITCSEQQVAVTSGITCA